MVEKLNSKSVLNKAEDYRKEALQVKIECILLIVSKLNNPGEASKHAGLS